MRGTDSGMDGCNRERKRRDSGRGGRPRDFRNACQCAELSSVITRDSRGNALRFERSRETTRAWDVLVEFGRLLKIKNVATSNMNAM